MKYVTFFAVIVLLAACVKERVISPTPKSDINLFVNEIQSSGSTLVNEYGVASDWIELYNGGDDTFKTAGRTFFISDSLGFRTKHKLPPFSIVPKGYLILYCDGENKVGTQIHTNFKLSSSGENAVLSYVDNNGDTTIIDSRIFGAIPSGKSDARVPDGSNTWKITNPTPGTSNQ